MSATETNSEPFLEPLSAAEMHRYSRHLLLPEVSERGQAKLRAAKVLCVGAGGLGSPLLLYLAAAGVGQLGIVDNDSVDVSNLQRQVLFGQAEVGQKKTAAAKQRLLQINPHIKIVTHEVRLDATNAAELIAQYEIVADGTDNFATRYLLNDACVLQQRPVVSASVLRFSGQISVFATSQGPCYRCLFPEPPPAALVPSCAEAGVLGVLPGVLGSLQALEVLKLILGIGQPLIGRLVIFDGMTTQFQEVSVTKQKDCPSCGEGVRTLTNSDDRVRFCADPPNGNRSEVQEIARMTVEELAKARHKDRDLQILDVREQFEFSLAHIPGSVWMPLRQLQERAQSLSVNNKYVITCHKGTRSLAAYHQLKAMGFSQLRILDGGVDAWAEKMDPTMVKY